MAHVVFISDPSRDKAAADGMVAAPERCGNRCWIAPRDVGQGEQRDGAIVTAIDGSRVFVLLFSSESDRSSQVVREVGRTVGPQAPIDPLRIERVEPTGDMAYYIGSIRWLDAHTPPLENHIMRGVRARSGQACA